MRISGEPADCDFVGAREFCVVMNNQFFTLGMVLEADTTQGSLTYIPTDPVGGPLYDQDTGDWKRVTVRGAVRVFERNPGAPWC